MAKRGPKKYITSLEDYQRFCQEGGKHWAGTNNIPGWAQLLYCILRGDVIECYTSAQKVTIGTNATPRRIKDLRDNGVIIEPQDPDAPMSVRQNEYGKTVHYREYFMTRENAQKCIEDKIGVEFKWHEYPRGHQDDTEMQEAA